jgi:hypothetical protein
MLIILEIYDIGEGGIRLPVLGSRAPVMSIYVTPVAPSDLLVGLQTVALSCKGFLDARTLNHSAATVQPPDGVLLVFMVDMFPHWALS